MILIRGFNQEQYAREIEKGQIGFRDVLTTLLYPIENGYKFSNYYEEYLIKTIVENSIQKMEYGVVSKKHAQQLDLIFDPYVPHFYVSYFHILNDDSEKWLSNFNEDARFIFAVPKIHSEIGEDETLYGKNMIGSRMMYLPPEGKALTQKRLWQKLGIISMIQNELAASECFGGTPIDAATYIIEIISSMCLELFSRRCNNGFDERENEFRILYKKPTPYHEYSNHFEAVEPREFKVLVNGIQYTGYITRDLTSTPVSFHVNYDMLLHTDNVLANNPAISLMNTVGQGNDFSICSDFLSVDIQDVFSSYGYIGDASQCREFIRKHIGKEANMQK